MYFGVLPARCLCEGVRSGGTGVTDSVSCHVSAEVEPGSQICYYVATVCYKDTLPVLKE